MSALQIDSRSGRAPTRALLAIVLVATILAGRAGALVIRQPLAITGADPDAEGTAKVSLKRRRGRSRGMLEVRARRLAAATLYQLTVDGVRIGTLATNRRGTGRARFRTEPHGREQLLGVDPRGHGLALLSMVGVTVLVGRLPDDSTAGDVRCCLRDDSGAECEDRTAAECAAEGGIDLGAGSCLPNPCQDTGAPTGDVACCVPDDSGPECEDRTAAQCAASGGIVVGGNTCGPKSCPALATPDVAVRCCLPDEAGTACEDRTAARCALDGGVNIGPGACFPNPCFPGGTTATTLPRTAVARLTCERSADGCKISVNGDNLPAGTYAARVTAGVNVAASPAAPTFGDEVEFDFDSEPGDIAQGATPIDAGFIQGDPPSVVGEIVDGAQAVVVQATALCVVR